MIPSETNLSLIDQIRGRTERMTLGGCGIRIASDYVRGVLTAAGMNGAVVFPDAPNLLKDSETRLVYRNEDMAYEPPMTSMPAIETYCKSISVDVPPRTLMVVENILTSSKEDRDGDRLFSEGAIIDLKMPALWHHMLPAVVGKMLDVREQNTKHVRVATAIMESPLGVDTANLIEFGALRISHGFRPLEFTPRDKGMHDRHSGPRGFDIKSYECLEESFVSVPSNTDAEIIAWSRGKVHTPLVKSWCKSLYDQRDKVYLSGAIKGGVVGAHVIQPADPNVIVPDYSIGERVPGPDEHFEETVSSTELTQQEVRDFIRSLTPGDLVSVEEKTEADVSQDSQTVFQGWSGRVQEVSPDYAEVAVTKPDGSPARVEADGRYRALVRQPEPKPEASSMDMLRIEPQPKGAEVTTPSDAPPLGKPFPNEHAARQVDPKKFEKFRRENDKFGEGIHAIWGITADGKTEVQSIRFDSSKFTEEEATKWLKKHGFKTTLEPAAKPEEKTMDSETKTPAEVVEKATPPAETDKEGEAAKCPECGNPVAPDKDGKCPECGAKMTPEKSAVTQTKAEDSHGSPMIEMIDGARSAIQVAIRQLDTASSHMGDVRTYFVTGEKSFDANEKTTKAGAVLSTANAGDLQIAVEALQRIAERHKPPMADSDYKPVPEPAASEKDTPADPPETTANKPTPVDLYKPDGSLNIQASCQAIICRMMDPVEASEIAVLGKLASAISADLKNHERAMRRSSLRKVLRI